MSKLAFLLLMTFSFTLSSCKISPHASWARMVDKFMFQWFGGTVIGSPQQLSMKAVHLDQGALVGRELIIEGRVLEYGKNETFMVMADESARMLVVLTNLSPSEQPFRELIPRNVRVLGTVERGKRGLPFVLARSFSPIPTVKAKKN